LQKQSSYAERCEKRVGAVSSRGTDFRIIQASKGASPPLPAALVCRGNENDACSRRASAEEFAHLKRGDYREGVLSRLPRGDRTGCDLVDCSQQRAEAGGQGICHASLYAGRRLGELIYFEGKPGRCSAAKLLSKDEARRIAANIAKLSQLPDC
jgi:hypothetical protein